MIWDYLTSGVFLISLISWILPLTLGIIFLSKKKINNRTLFAVLLLVYFLLSTAPMALILVSGIRIITIFTLIYLLFVYLMIIIPLITTAILFSKKELTRKVRVWLGVSLLFLAVLMVFSLGMAIIALKSSF
jgi:hypothetical protein